ncbi:MAG: peptide chain release factor N(5)-glutamine methyltransferase [Fibrobacteria bacterium]|nr:peptide chain release factor N(5)-glutamine methyltransferase [Fibrobacteria bacterium]
MSLPSLGDLLRKTEEFFQRKEIENPRGDARRLLAHGLGLTPMQVMLQFDRPLTDPEVAVLRELVSRRGRGEPLQHILGVVGFRHLEIRCDARALVPRPETEQLVDLAQEKLAHLDTPRVHEVGVGTGCVALSMRHEKAKWRVTGSDLSPDALALARHNAQLLGIWTPFLRMDLLDGFLPESLDAVVSNPPYIASSEIPGLSAEVRCDPLLALDGGKDGLVVVARLAEQALRILKPGGWLLVEHGHDQGPSSVSLCGEGWAQAATVPDLAGLDRFLVAQKRPASL